VNNAAIANSRIVNCARSARAIVTIKAFFVITATQEKIETFRVRVENYLIDRPETWAGMVHFRNNMVDYNQGYVEYLLRAQHQHEWQYVSRKYFPCLHHVVYLSMIYIFISKYLTVIRVNLCRFSHHGAKG
jgi:hypothetical protein